MRTLYHHNNVRKTNHRRRKQKVLSLLSALTYLFINKNHITQKQPITTHLNTESKSHIITY